MSSNIQCIIPAHSLIEPPAGQLRFTEPSTIKFTTSLLNAASSLFPSKYFSTGGDEINIPCYDQDGPTQATLKSTGKTLEQALSTFVQSTHSALRAKGKTAVVWEEMVLAHNVTLANDTIVMVWISSDNVKAVAEKGYKIIHSASDYFYLVRFSICYFNDIYSFMIRIAGMADGSVISPLARVGGKTHCP